MRENTAVHADSSIGRVLRSKAILSLAAAVTLGGLLTASRAPGAEYTKKELAARVNASPSKAPAVDPMPPEDPTAKPAFDEAEKAIAHFKLMKPYQATVWAAEPQFMNPVALSVDNHGRAWVVETHRYRGGGVLDIRNIYDWLEEDLACRTVEDRIAEVKRHWPDSWQELTKNHDRIRLLEDSSGSGRADHAVLWADGFNDLADGIASGVITRKDNVYFTDIPNLWLLKDPDHKGVATEKKVLSTGYGTRYSFEGHDLHGLRFGPDGRLYFSCGDRGFNVTTKEGKQIAYPDEGGVLRCEPDGSNLELFARGLRNPQKLCFDDHGNLFTGDNNSDNGDPAKWFYVTEGADCGWRVGYQHIKSPRPTGVLLMENVMNTEKDNNQRYMTPPIAHITNGPSGCTFYPGTGMPDSFNGHFLLCDFKGGQTNSGIWTFTMKPHGASFEMPDRQQFIWQFLSTDVEFIPGGGIFATDWVNGWPRPNKGRIYHFFDADSVKKPIVAEVKKLLDEGFEKRSADELTALLSHADMRVRQEAQFELADRGAGSVQAFMTALGQAPAKSTYDASRHDLGRLHAIWGLGQIARKTPGAADGLVPLLKDADEEVRAQAAKILGESHVAAAYDGLIPLLNDQSLRVQFFAAQALGHIGNRAAIPALLACAEHNADKDAFVRHAVVSALAWIGDAEGTLAAGAKSDSPSVRLATVLVMRRLERPEAAQFLTDADAKVVLEAARAIDDVPIDAGRPQLAKLLANVKLDPMVLRRALNANYREGKPENAAAVVAFASDAGAPESVRVEAIELLGLWAHPSPRDYIIGVTRPLDPAKRDAGAGEAAVKPALANVIKSGSKAIKVAALELAEDVGLQPLDLAYDLFADKQEPAEVRTAALKVLGAQKSDKLADALKIGMVEKAPALRREAIRLQTQLPGAVEKLNAILTDAPPADQQSVFAALPLVGGDAADQILATWLDKLKAGQVPVASQLDLLEAAAKSKSKAVHEKLAAFEKSREADAQKEYSLANYRECLEGGDAAAGRKVFFEKAEVSCVRCHMVGKEGGGNVGPNLIDLGKRQNREYILESIVYPNAKIAPGFESASVKLNDGRFLTGVVKDETADGFKLDTGTDAGVVAIKKSDIKFRKPAPSPMPEDIAKPLTKQEIRNLVEYLASQKGEPPTAQK